jgi:hypothetical protein
VACEEVREEEKAALGYGGFRVWVLTVTCSTTEIHRGPKKAFGIGSPYRMEVGALCLREIRTLSLSSENR